MEGVERQLAFNLMQLNVNHTPLVTLARRQATRGTFVILVQFAGIVFVSIFAGALTGLRKVDLLLTGNALQRPIVSRYSVFFIDYLYCN